jgi:hypothetical protein
MNAASTIETHPDFSTLSIMSGRISFCLLMAICVVAFANTNAVYGDDVILDRSASASVAVGDFSCSSCPNGIVQKLNLRDKHSLTTGDLWSFFDDQGIKSVDRLTLCLDWEPSLAMNDVVDVKNLNFMIQNDDGEVLTDFNLGDNRLVVPDYEVTGFKPEARVEIDLGYNFMERFTADSSQHVIVNIASSDAMSTSPELVLAAAKNFLPRELKIVGIVMFGAFWICVFFVLNWTTRPKEEADSAPVLVSMNVGETSKAMSA